MTVLVEHDNGDAIDADSPESEALRDRMTSLLAEVERRTGATVVGLAGDRAQLAGWRFDHELDARLPLAA